MKAKKRSQRPNTNSFASSNKKATITLSLDKKILEDIRKDANKKRLSINAMINNILTKYCIVYKNYEDLQCHILPHKNFQVLLDNIDENIILEINKMVIFVFYFFIDME